MVFESIGRVVGGTYYLDIELLHQSLASEFLCLELCRALFIYCSGCLRIQLLIYIKASCELKVGPMVKRVSHGIRNGLRPFFEFLIASASSGYEFFRNSVATHGAPFIMVSAEPYLGKILELVVVSDHLRHEVTVVVDDRHVFSAFMIKLACIIIREHEVFVDERSVLDHSVKF